VTDDERREALEAIAREVRVCTACRLHTGRRQAVPGEGSAATEVVFVGEGPGATEDEQGRPFVGAAGGLLTELIGSIGWRRDEVFITNVVKCRPPGNRDPEPDEIAACSGYLKRQLEALDPALIVTLGRFSLQSFMPGARISSAHGTVRPVDPATGAADASVMALYHPAAAFRQAALRETLFDDIAEAPEALLRSRDRRAQRPGVTTITDDGPSASNPSLGTASVPAEVAGADPTAIAVAEAPIEIAVARVDAGADEPTARPADASPSSDLGPDTDLVTADDPNQMRFF
jgi:uracil-DNA glycosylase